MSEQKQQLNRLAVPRHVAIIPDGNRRWAVGRDTTVYKGHQEGVRIFEEVSEHAAERGVQHLSVWGMSLDNLRRRSPREVAGLWRIFGAEFRRLTTSASIHERQTRINVFGRWREKFPTAVKRSIEAAMAATREYDNHCLNFFLAYNGTDEMVRAVRGVAKQVRQQPTLRITPRVLKAHLLTRDLPPVDLLIRTAGEPHLSAGFMMWEVADAELYFTDTLWPDFGSVEFDRALNTFSRRQRRFGA